MNAAAERRLSEYISEIQLLAGSLLKRDYQVAFVGSIGIGKSTARWVPVLQTDQRLVVAETMYVIAIRRSTRSPLLRHHFVITRLRPPKGLACISGVCIDNERSKLQQGLVKNRPNGLSRPSNGPLRDLVLDVDGARRA